MFLPRYFSQVLDISQSRVTLLGVGATMGEGVSLGDTFITMGVTMGDTLIAMGDVSVKDMKWESSE